MEEQAKTKRSNRGLYQKDSEHYIKEKKCKKISSFMWFLYAA